jgi:hypothetical protein
MKTFTLLLALLLLPGRAFADERWYILTIAGVPVGWVSEERDGSRTRVAMSARLTRLGKSIDMRFDTLTIEDAGALTRLEYEALLSKQPMRVTVQANGERFRITSGATERVIDRGREPVIGPAAVVRLTAERLHAVDDRVSFTMFSPEFQKVVNVGRRLVAKDDVSPCGGAVANKIEERIEGLATPRTLWLDADAVLVGDTIAGPFGPMATCRSSKEAALTASGTLPADLYERTVARSNVRFADPFAVDRIVVRIRPRDKAQALPDFTAHNQRLLEPGLVEVRRPSYSSRSEATVATREYLDSNALVESDNADVAAIARSLKRDTSLETAQALTAWTAEHMTMDAGIVMAPASELVRDRRATCVGYATMLAALARAVSIPSRVAMGYVYYGGIWGGHAWTEMFVDGQWLPFDAAVYAPGIAGATRLSVGTSSLVDGGGSLNGALAALFGKVDVDTVEYDAGGGVVKAKVGEPPYTIDGHTYLNTGLGLRVRALGFDIERADSTWPSTLVVSFRRGETVVELHQRAVFPEKPQPGGTTVIAERVGGTVLVWTASGPDAAAALRELVNKVERVR